MKRSEALKAIKKAINGINFEDCYPEEVNDHAFYILGKLESMGMLPPTICYNAVGEYQKIKDTDILHDNDISFQWEPEDET